MVYRDTSDPNQVNANQEDSEASNPGWEQLPQNPGRKKRDEGGGEGTHHVGPQKFAIGIIPTVALLLRNTETPSKACE